MSLLARKVPTFPVALGLCGIALTSFYTAWLSDDCFFTLRTVANALAGHGLRWNVFERVQAYTHPLWLLTLLGPMGVAGEHYLTRSSRSRRPARSPSADRAATERPWRSASSRTSSTSCASAVTS